MRPAEATGAVKNARSDCRLTAKRSWPVRTWSTGPTDIYLPENLKMDIAESGKGIGAVSSKTWTGALGVGVDIGTTSVVTHLTDMETGARLATVSGVNAQRQFGADVISRIQYCMKEGKRHADEAHPWADRRLYKGALRKNRRGARGDQGDLHSWQHHHGASVRGPGPVRDGRRALHPAEPLWNRGACG